MDNNTTLNIRVLLYIKREYLLDLKKVQSKLEEHGFVIERTIIATSMIIGNIDKEKLTVLSCMPEIKEIHTSHKKTCSTKEEHEKIYSGENKGKFYYIWICSKCGQLEFDVQFYPPKSDSNKFQEVFSKFINQ